MQLSPTNDTSYRLKYPVVKWSTAPIVLHPIVAIGYITEYLPQVLNSYSELMHLQTI